MKDLTNLFGALADETRFRIINLLLERELCVCELVEILDMSQPRISRHLNILKQTGLLHNWREGKWIHYSIKKELPNYCKTLLNGVKEGRSICPLSHRDPLYRGHQGLSQNKLGKIDLQKLKKVFRKTGKPCPAR